MRRRKEKSSSVLTNSLVTIPTRLVAQESVEFETVWALGGNGLAKSNMFGTTVEEWATDMLMFIAFGVNKRVISFSAEETIIGVTAGALGMAVKCPTLEAVVTFTVASSKNHFKIFGAF